MSRAFPEDCEYVPGSARFTNDKKDNIELLYKKIDNEYIATSIMPADTNYSQYNWVLENCDNLDNIHANTYRWIREARHAYEQQVLEIAKQEGLIFNSSLSGIESYKTFLGQLFKPFDDTKESELNNLFSVKLELFEMPNIRQNENAELKKALRRAETPLDVIRAAIDIHLDNVEKGIEILEDSN